MTTKPQASKRKRTLKKHQKAILQAIESGKIKIKTPMDILFEKADMKCSICGAKAGTCDCWHPCDDPDCHWSVEKGHECNNPKHGIK
jgi:hypothetical protein